MSKILEIKGAGFTISADLTDVSFILAEPFEKGADPQNLNIRISEDSVKHNVMGYTTDIGTLELIFQKKTLRSSSLSNAKLNDPMEKERVGVSKFAGSRFITCFCQLDHECVPFWMYYGKDIRKDKVLMQFRNFSDRFEECFYTDYALVDDNKRCYFQSPDYGAAINSQWNSGISTKEYDLRACIDSISIFDVEYIPIYSDVFTEDNAGEASVDFGKVTGQNDATVVIQGYNPTVLGKQKSNPWDYEKETRILSTLSNQQFSDWEFVDLRLKPEIYSGLRVMLSPWDDGTLRSKVEEIINNSGLPSDIIESIEIVDSGLKGKLNFPEV